MISYLYSVNPRVGINKNYKHFKAPLIETICFNFRLDIGITNFSDIVYEFVPVTKHMKGRENKIQMHPMKKNRQIKCVSHELCHV